MIFVLVLLLLKAMASEIGPTRPQYMVQIMIIFPARLRLGVKFRDSPTVPVALTASNMISKAGASVTADRRTVDRYMMENDMITTVMALLTNCFDMLLPNSAVWLLLLIMEAAVNAKTVTVTVFTPPAVPTGEPPINMSSKVKNADAFVRFSCGTVAKPAVLVVTDWKNDTWILSNTDISLMVSGLLYSKIKYKTAPPMIRIKVDTMAILLCRDKFLKMPDFSRP